MNYVKYFFMLVLLVLVSCSNSQKHKVQQTKFNIISGDELSNDSLITIKIDLKNLEEFNLDALIENIDYIPLETNKKCILGEITKIKFCNNKFLIFDRITNSILIFSKNGRFEQKIANLGKGPGEYNKISDFDVNEKLNEIIIFSDLPQKIIKYSFSGKYISEFQTSFYSRHFSLLPNNNFAFYLEYMDNSKRIKKEFNLIICDSIGKIKHGYFPYDSKKLSNFFYKSSLHFFGFDTKRHFVGDLNDTLYSISDNKIIPKYFFDFMDYSFDQNIIETSVDDQNNYFKSKSYAFIYNIFDTEDILITNFIYKSSLFYNFFFKRSGKNIVCQSPKSGKNLLGNLTLYEKGQFIGYLDNMSILPFRSNIKQMEIEEPLKEIIHNWKESDNPIMVMYNLRIK